MRPDSRATPLARFQGYFPDPPNSTPCCEPGADRLCATNQNPTLSATIGCPALRPCPQPGTGRSHPRFGRYRAEARQLHLDFGRARRKFSRNHPRCWSASPQTSAAHLHQPSQTRFTRPDQARGGAVRGRGADASHPPTSAPSRRRGWPSSEPARRARSTATRSPRQRRLWPWSRLAASDGKARAARRR